MKFPHSVFFIPVFFFVIIGAPLLTSLPRAHSSETPSPGSNPLRIESAPHPVSIVEADVFVQQFKTTMRLKCFADDLELLQGLQSIEDGTYDLDEMRDAADDHAKFLGERIQLLNADGQVLQPKVTGVVYPEPIGDVIRQGELMNYSLTIQLEYSYEKAPEFLTIRQTMMGEGYLLPSELQILLRQDGSDAPYRHMMKPDSPETFRLDWTNPVLNKDASEEDWEKWFDEQRSATLGITSYSSVYSFIYIERFEVRHEILIPLATLATMIDFQRADEFYMDVPEQDLAAEQLKEFFSVGNEVTIDGIVVNPVIDRIDFYGLDLRDFAIQAERKRISMANGRVGLILSYSCKAPPEEVTVSWDLFNDAIKTVDSVIFIGNKIEKTQFSSFIESNTWKWNAAGDLAKLPAITSVAADDLARVPAPRIGLLSVLLGLVAAVILIAGRPKNFASRSLLCGMFLAGSYLLWPFAGWNLPIKTAYAPIENEQASSIFSRLHGNLFRAFDYHRESDVYDSLEHSLHGPLLKQLYLQIQESLRVREQGGAVARIDSVELESGSVEKSDTNEPIPQFDYRARWNLLGTIEHWGHLHQRENQYEAIFHVELVENDWKITSMQTVDESQGQVKTSLRKF